MAILNSNQIKEFILACEKLSEEEKVIHVGVINSLGYLVAVGFQKGIKPMLEDDKIRMTHMQLPLDFKMRQELDNVLESIDYVASRRTKQLIISVPIGENLVLITSEPDANDKRIIKRAEEIFDDITISTIQPM